MSPGRLPPPIAPEDDWFDEPEWFPEPDVARATGGEAPREPRTRVREPVTSSRGRRRGRRMVVLAILGALALVVAGVVAARALTGSGSGDETTTTTEATPTTPTITTAPTTPTAAETTTPTTTETTTPGTESLRPGAEGPRVRQLQEDLAALGYSTGGVDGKYGPATERAVQAFQTSSGLVVDGVAGPATLAALAQALEG